MKRKSPIQHTVRAHLTHTKKGRVTQVRNYIRGRGAQSKPYVTKRVLPKEELKIFKVAVGEMGFQDEFTYVRAKNKTEARRRVIDAGDWDSIGKAVEVESVPAEERKLPNSPYYYP